MRHGSRLHHRLTLSLNIASVINLPHWDFPSRLRKHTLPNVAMKNVCLWLSSLSNKSL